MPLEPGDVFAGYRIIRLIGVGGMGAVYLADHPRLPRRDALKVLDVGLGRADDVRARFEREAELSARLEHPHIVSVYDCGSEGDRLWIAMRYIDGPDADELIRRNPAGLPLRRAVGIIDGAARGLDAAHRRHLLHRDVKPANILVGTAFDGTDDVRVADFGIARALDATAGPTATGSVPATIAYAAPEQFDSSRPLDHRVDVYGLGCTLHHLVTGTVPFAGRTTAATIHGHLFEPPPRASQLRPGLPAAIDDVIARAMAKNPDDRFGSCGEFAAAARQAIDHTGESAMALRGSPVPSWSATNDSAAPGAPVRSGPPPASIESASASTGRRPRWPWVAAAVALAVIAAVAVAVPRLSQDVAGTAVAGSRTPTNGTGAAASGDTDTTPSGDTDSGDTDSTTSGDTDTTPSGAASSSTDPASTQSGGDEGDYSAWGPAAYIVAAFPDLLPTTPEATGYQGMRCAMNDAEGTWLHCPDTEGDGISVNIHCDPQRGRLTYRRDGIGETDVHEQPWTRPSGSGTVRWVSDDTAGFGLLDVDFNEPDRYFCIVGASGGSGGQDVFDRWWTGAPI